ncbi:putative tolloid-like protein 1, partial [Apostichopus japonicus]
ACGGYFNTSGSEFSSPNFPGEYANNEQCSYRVESAAEKFVLLQFENFDLENGESCSYDVVKVYDGLYTSDNLLGSYCGGELPGPIYSSGSAMLVTFESDGSEIASGFSGVFTFVEDRPTTTAAPTPAPDGSKLV